MSTLSACPDGASIAAYLLRVRAACREDRVQVTKAAREDAEDIGYDFAGIVADVEALDVADFEKCEPSTARPSDFVWVFCPETAGLVLWVRLVERGDVVVVSFHDK